MLFIYFILFIHGNIPTYFHFKYDILLKFSIEPCLIIRSTNICNTSSSFDNGKLEKYRLQNSTQTVWP